jgi:signal transduction histidine kinase
VWESGESVVVEEYAARLSRHTPGQSGYFTFVFQARRDAQGQMTRIGCVALNVTAQVVARQQVEDLNEELASINEELTATNEELHVSNTRLTRANTDLGTFAYTASHALKAPITNVEGLVVALRDPLPAAVQQDELVGQLLDLLDTMVYHFLDTIIQLTDLSRLQRSYEEPTELLALAPVVDGVLADLAPAIAEAGADVQVQVPAWLRTPSPRPAYAASFSTCSATPSRIATPPARPGCNCGSRASRRAWYSRSATRAWV